MSEIKQIKAYRLCQGILQQTTKSPDMNLWEEVGCPYADNCRLCSIRCPLFEFRDIESSKTSRYTVMLNCGKRYIQLHSAL